MTWRVPSCRTLLPQGYFPTFHLQNAWGLSSLLLRVKLDLSFSLKSPIVKTTITMDNYKSSHCCQTNWPHTACLPLYSKDRRMKLSARRLITFCLALLVIQVTDLSAPVSFQQGSMNFPEQELLFLSDHCCFHLTLSKDVECGVSLPMPTCHLSTNVGGVCLDLLYISKLGYLLRFCIF